MIMISLWKLASSIVVHWQLIMMCVSSNYRHYNSQIEISSPSNALRGNREHSHDLNNVSDLKLLICCMHNACCRQHYEVTNISGTPSALYLLFMILFVQVMSLRRNNMITEMWITWASGPEGTQLILLTLQITIWVISSFGFIPEINNLW